jgi:glutamine amidotransferase
MILKHRQVNDNLPYPIFFGRVTIKDIVIVDYGSGNLRSIRNAFNRIGTEVKVSSDKKVLDNADALVIPGVGAFGVAMNNISPFSDIIKRHVESNKPLLGICLGLQLLFESSEESKDVKGLELLEGTVKRFNLESQYKIPHMGWNQIKINNTPKNNVSILEGVDNEYMYFVHSYYINPSDEDVVTAYTNYSMDVPVAIGKNNLFALQFHPEKSGKAGLRILNNFVNL